MQKKILSFVFVINLLASGFFTCCAQTIEYSHDNAGNRTQRQLVLINPRLSSPFDTINEDNKNNDVQSFAMKYGVNITPNPASEEILITVAANRDGTSSALLILDIGGKVILKETINSIQHNLNVSMLKPGTYYLNFSKNNQHLYYKLVKL